MIVDNIADALAATQSRGGNASHDRVAVHNATLVATCGENIKNAGKMQALATRINVHRRTVAKAHKTRLRDGNVWKLARRLHGGGRFIPKRLAKKVSDWWIKKTRPLPTRRDQRHLSRYKHSISGTFVGALVSLQVTM